MNWSEYSQKLLDKCKKQEIPFHVGFELTPFCNFSCNMCYIRLDNEQASKQGKQLTTDQWLQFAYEAKQMGALSMEVTGGEALLRPDFDILYKYFISLGFLIILRTNGYLIDNKKIDLLSRYRPYKICITLYGATDRTYKKICGIPNGFSTVSENIIALRDAGLTVQLTATITVDNEGEVDMMTKWANDHGFALTFSGMLLTPISSTGRNVEHLRISIPKEEYELTEEMVDIPRPIDNKDFYMNPFWMCRLFGVKFTITWDGKMTMCNSNPSIWSNPVRYGINTAFQDLYKQLKQIHRPAKCKKCSYIDLCSICPSMMYSATGNMEEVNDDLCKYAHKKYKRLLMNNKTDNNSNYSIDKCNEGDT